MEEKNIIEIVKVFLIPTFFQIMFNLLLSVDWLIVVEFKIHDFRPVFLSFAFGPRTF